MKLILARMLWNFDFERSPRAEGWLQQKSYIIWERPPLWIKVKARSDIPSVETT